MPTYDLVLHGGMLIDPAQGISAARDVAFRDGRVAAVAERLTDTAGAEIVEASGAIVTPGLIDLHAHVYHGALYIAHHQLTFPILLDPDLKTAGAWRVTSLPATFIVRPGGEVVGMAVGAREWNSAEMRALLEMLLPQAH